MSSLHCLPAGGPALPSSVQAGAAEQDIIIRTKQSFHTAAASRALIFQLTPNWLTSLPDPPTQQLRVQHILTADGHTQLFNFCRTQHSTAQRPILKM